MNRTLPVSTGRTYLLALFIVFLAAPKAFPFEYSFAFSSPALASLQAQRVAQHDSLKSVSGKNSAIPLKTYNTGSKEDLEISLLGTYKTGVFDEGAAEISAYDAATKRLFVVNANGSVDVLDIKNPSVPTKLFDIPIKEIIGGTPNSVAVQNGIVAVAVEIVEEDTETQLNGKVAFFKADLKQAPTAPMHVVTVGALPDMLTFTPDGSKILVANEGEPSETANPKGSVSIIDVSGGIESASAITIDFTGFDGKENELKAKGVRLYPDTPASIDLEPEYIAISPDTKLAYITLQEANAFAVLDIATAQFKDIIPLGYKDWSRGKASLQQYAFNEPPIGKKGNGEDILFGGLSGLHFEKEENGKYIFVAVPDRGPNGDETPAGRPFLKPDYKAEVIRFELDKNSGVIKIREKIALKRKVGDTEVAITGFPNIPGFDEKPIDEAGNDLPYDPYGADLEGVVTAPDRTFWMVDEYRPAIYHFSADGEMLHRYVPKGTAALANPAQPEGSFGSETLPAEYAKRRSNRGFEAMALDTDKGILYAFIQTPLANPNRLASDNSNVIRILGIDPATGEPVSEYVYLLEKPAFRSTLLDKMGDAAYDAKTGKIYVVERDDNAQTFNKKYIFQIDLTGATNLLAAGAPALLPGKTLEQHTADDLAAVGVKPVHKNKVVNLPSLGYLPSDKVEGVTVLPDGSLAVINDNDFGIAGFSTVALGIVSFEEGNTLDVSDRDSGINLQNWPVFGMYMPDGVSAFQTNGQTYYVTANEGDVRVPPLEESIRAGNEEVVLDPTAFPNAQELQSNEQLGRLDISAIDGDIDGDGDYDQLYTYGARSFSIWDQYGNLVFDSGDDLEKITAAALPDYFNVSHTDNTLDSRSDSKGPEPEGIVVAQLKGRTYAFIGLERIGGFMVYDISDPVQPKFATYVNNRDFTADPESPEAGDLGPEGLLFISAKDSPTGIPLLVVTNEISGSTSIYSINKATEVFDFTLVNAATDTDIISLKDGAVIDYAKIATTKLNIRANVSPEGVGSVKFSLNGVASVDNSALFSLFGDNNGNYKDWTPAPGEYTLTATPYSGTSGTGTAGIPLTISFKVVYSATIASFTLVNAQTTTDIAQLKNGDVINLKYLETNKLAIRANAAPEQVGSVVFGLNNNSAYNTENILPYALFRNKPNNIDYNQWTPKPGTYTVTATPYAAANGNGAKGASRTITFTVIDEAVLIETFVLVEAETGTEVMEIKEGDKISLDDLNISNFNIRAKVSPEKVGYVTFELQAATDYKRTEAQSPYELFGDGGAQSENYTLAEGTYLLTATPYSRFSKGKFNAGSSLAIQFEIISSQASQVAARRAVSEESSAISHIKVYPNPVKDKLIVDFGETVAGEVSVKVYDLIGRKVYLEEKTSISGQQRLEVNVAQLPNRFYLVRIHAGTFSKTVKIMKE